MERRFRLKAGKYHMGTSPVVKVIKAIHPKDDNDNVIGSCLLPGSVIKCEPFNIKHFIDSFDMLDEGENVVASLTEDEQEEEELAETNPTSPLKAVKVEGGYNVVNRGTGKPINNEPLTKEDADSLVEETSENKGKFKGPKNKAPNVYAKAEEAGKKKTARKKKTTSKKTKTRKKK